jgi:hypothetical protein
MILLSFLSAILVFALAMGFICSATFSSEHLYAQEAPTEGKSSQEFISEDLQQSCPAGTGPDPDGGCSPIYSDDAQCPAGTGPDPDGGCSPIYSNGVPSQQLGESDVPSQQLGESDVPSQQLGESDVPSQQLGESDVPSQQPSPADGPFQNIIDIPDLDLPDVDVPNIDIPKVDVPKIPAVEEIVKDPAGSVENTLSTISPNIPVSTLMIVGVVAVVTIGGGIAAFSRHHHGRSKSSHPAQYQTQKEDTKEELIYEDVQIVTQGGIEEV